jgi:adenylate cyclase
VVDAVECAVVLQRGMAERNAGLAAGQRIDVRIGINLGDVIVEDEDRHGEGVNIGPGAPARISFSASCVKP